MNKENNNTIVKTILCRIQLSNEGSDKFQIWGMKHLKSTTALVSKYGNHCENECS